MTIRRIALLGLSILVCCGPMVGCQDKEAEGEDKPLMQNAPPPPPRPKKPEVSPKGAGGGPPATTTPKGAAGDP